MLILKMKNYIKMKNYKNEKMKTSGKIKNILLILLAATYTNVSVFAQANGATSVFQLASIGHDTYLIDTIGNTYNTWQCSANAASTAYLLKDGSILRPYKVSNPSMSGGATGGGIQIIDWNNNVSWEYLWSDQDHQQHHECKRLSWHTKHISAP